MPHSPRRVAAIAACLLVSSSCGSSGSPHGGPADASSGTDANAPSDSGTTVADAGKGGDGGDSGGGGGAGDASSHDAATDGAGDAALTPESIVWQPLGPIYPKGDSGKLVTLAKSPTNASLLLVGGDNGGPGIYRSTDRGLTWKAANKGLLDVAGEIDSQLEQLWYPPGATSTVLAYTSQGLYRSTDDGQSWASTYRFKGGIGDGIDLFAPSGSDVLAATADGLLISHDSGGTWSADQPGNFTNVLAAGGLLLASLDDGTVQQFKGGKWTLLSKLPAGVHQLAVDPKSPTVIYAGVANGSYNYNLYGSTNGGTSFASITYPSNLLGTQSIAFSTTVDHRLYVAGDVSAVYITADGNTAPKTTDAPLPVDTRHLYVEPNTAGTDDRCWTASDQGIHVNETCSGANSPHVGLGAPLETNLVTGFAVSSDGTALVAMLQDFSAASSQDSGKTWQEINVGEDGAGAFSPTDPLRCFAFEDKLYLSTDGCKTVASTGTMSGPTYQGQVLAFDPKTPTTMYAIGSVSNVAHVYKSTDSGKTFADAGFPFTAPTALAIDPADATHLVLVDGTNAISVSTNGGGGWTASTGLAGADSLLVAIHPFDKKTVVAMGSSGGKLTIYTSTDGGLSFAPGYTLPGGQPMAIAWNSATKGVPLLAFGTEYQGLYLSADMGHSFMRLDSALITHKYTSLQWRNGVLYVGTYGQGILRTATALQ